MRIFRDRRQSHLVMHIFVLLISAVIICNTSDLLKRYSYFHAAVRFTDAEMEEFRKMDIGENALRELSDAAESKGQDFIQLITVNMLMNGYHISDNSILYKNPNKLGGIGYLYESDTYHALYSRYAAVFADLVYFPVPEDRKGESVYFSDSWSSPRSYGGKRSHEGTDVMASNNERGYFPIVSITEGVVEKVGWLELGGYRIGIRSPNGGYFYYAHLYSYLPEIKEGDYVNAGDIIGFMGDTGYSKAEGTTGQFDTHLHLGIYLEESGGEISVNPYPILKYLEAQKQMFQY